MAEINIGDIVEICEISMFHGTRWRPAFVDAVGDGKLLARLHHGAFDAEGHIMKWFPLNERGRMWR